MDNGREYSLIELSEFLTDFGTVIETTTPRNPHQDGPSERAIRIVLEKMRSIIIDQHIPENLWPEIFKAVVHITNRTATSLLEGVTPYQALADFVDETKAHIPSVSHFRVLGCKTYVLIEKEDRVASQKLAPRAQVGILVGYEGTHIYRVFVPNPRGSSGKIIRTSHARFDEGGIITASSASDDEAVPWEEEPLLLNSVSGEPVPPNPSSSVPQNQDREVIDVPEAQDLDLDNEVDLSPSPTNEVERDEIIEYEEDEEEAPPPVIVPEVNAGRRRYERVQHQRADRVTRSGRSRLPNAGANLSHAISLSATP
jgi:hypothetical protein